MKAKEETRGRKIKIRKRKLSVDTFSREDEKKKFIAAISLGSINFIPLFFLSLRFEFLSFQQSSIFFF